VSFGVHDGCLRNLIKCTVVRENQVLSLIAFGGRFAKIVFRWLANFLGPLVTAGVGFTEGFFFGCSVLRFLDIIEFISESIKILSFYYDVNVIGLPRRPSVSVWLLEENVVVLLQSKMLDSDSRLLSVGLSVLADVFGGSLALASDGVETLGGCGLVSFGDGASSGKAGIKIDL
jgi:hypothetical protein